MKHKGFAGITVLNRHYLSSSHLAAARLFAELSLNLEKTTAPTPEDRRLNVSYALSSIILSVAYLESSINELFCDCADGSSRVLGLVSAERIGQSWKNGIPRTASFSVIQKYSQALLLSDLPLLPTDAGPVQSVEVLIKLRNALIHAEAETIVAYTTVPEDEKRIHKLSRSLRGRFPPGAFWGAGNAIFPDHALGAGCANWAVKSAVEFTDLFYSTLGFRPLD